MGKERDSTLILKILLGLGLAYIAPVAIVLLRDSLVLAPQLDAKENLLWASRIVAGNMPAEPLYRALLYPFILGKLGVVSTPPTAGVILGLFCHLANGALVWCLAKKIWNAGSPHLLATLLYLVNPASLFFAFQLLDITLAITLFLIALVLVIGPRASLPGYLAGGLFCGLAVLARPHFLPVVLILPFAVALLLNHGRWKAAVIYVPLFAVFLFQGIFNHRLSGEFRILPWQGAYNLWAANKPDANGLFFKQSVDLALRGSDENPTRAESIFLYGKTHPEETAPYSIRKMNTYWRDQFLSRVREDPVALAGLWLFKAYAVANSFEQYNNLTFAFHKDRVPLLSYNPINWGILFILGIIGLMQLYRDCPRLAVAMALIILAYVSVLILFYASGRFRLPLVPLVAVLAGGSLPWFHRLLQERRRLLLTVLAVASTASLAFSSFNGIRGTETYIQDKLLMANANADLDRDLEAAQWARQVLQESSERLEAQRIYAVSYFNLRLTGSVNWSELGSWEAQRNWVKPSATNDPDLATVLAFFKWHWGEKDTATRIWEQVSKAHGSAPSLAGLTLSVLERKSSALTPNQQRIRTLLDEE